MRFATSMTEGVRWSSSATLKHYFVQRDPSLTCGCRPVTPTTSDNGNWLQLSVADAMVPLEVQAGLSSFPPL
jgi:hypothetical protein